MSYFMMMMMMMMMIYIHKNIYRCIWLVVCLSGFISIKRIFTCSWRLESLSSKWKDQERSPTSLSFQLITYSTSQTGSLTLPSPHLISLCLLSYYLYSNFCCFGMHKYMYRLLWPFFNRFISAMRRIGNRWSNYC